VLGITVFLIWHFFILLVCREMSTTLSCPGTAGSMQI